MKKLTALTALTLAVLSGVAHADRLADIKQAGVLRVAAFDSNSPFGFVDAKSKQIEALGQALQNSRRYRQGGA